MTLKVDYIKNVSMPQAKAIHFDMETLDLRKRILNMLHLPGEPQSVSIQAAYLVPSIVQWRKENGSAELCEEPQGKNYPADSYSFFTSCRPWPCYASVSQAPALGLSG